MEFIPGSGADSGDLQILASCLVGTQESLTTHIVSMGLEVYNEDDLLEDLEDGGFLDSCDECGVWEYPQDLDTGMCHICAEIDDELNQFFGFDDDDFEDDNVLDEEFDDLLFDETDEEDNH